MAVILGFRREVAENCALLGCEAARSGFILPAFQDNISVPIGFLNPDDGTDKSSQNVRYRLPLIAA